MAVVKEGDVILLEGDIEYFVEKCIELNNESYLIVRKINYSISSILNFDEGKVKVVQEFIDDNDDYYLKIVDDMNILMQIKEIANKD